MILKASFKYDYRHDEKAFYVSGYKGLTIFGGIVISLVLIILLPYFVITTSQDKSLYLTYGYWLIFFAVAWIGIAYLLFINMIGVLKLSRLAKNKVLKRKLKYDYFIVK